MPVGTVVPSLTRWGISADGDLVYRALATFGPQSANQSARELGMAPRRVHYALEELAEAGAVSAVATDSRSGRSAMRLWQADPAERAVHTLRRRRMRLVDPWQTARQHLATIDGLALPDSVDLLETGQIRVLRGMDLIRERLGTLAALERFEHLAMNPQQELTASTVAAAAPLDKAVLTRGVKMRTLGVPPGDGDESGNHSAELAALGCKHRDAKSLPLKVMTLDRKVAIVPVDLLNMGNGVLEIHEPGLVQSLVSIILREWDGAWDPERAAVLPVALTSRERALISLLAAGHTDAAVSRRVGMSVRTVGYTLRGLMDRLHVENRFQLGLALGSQGAFTPARSGGARRPVPEPRDGTGR